MLARSTDIDASHDESSSNSYAGDGSAAVQRARGASITVVAVDADVPDGTDGSSSLTNARKGLTLVSMITAFIEAPQQ
jgi:DNA-binding response OmpR family regulator